MKISGIRIKGFRQFGDVRFDFTDPQTGKPLDRVCFIGANGTGKSTLLELMSNFLAGKSIWYGEPEEVVVFVQNQGKIEEFVLHGGNLTQTLAPREFNHALYLKAELDGEKAVTLIKSDWEKIPEISQATTTIQELQAEAFWGQLTTLVKERETEKMRFEERPENLEKTKRQLNEEFDQRHPKIEVKLAEIWNKLLYRCHLEVDLEQMKYPTYSDRHFEVFLRLVHSKKNLPYERLSTGIRHFIFRMGHIFSLYFNRVIKAGFLFVDEPENSLHPDFLYDLIDIYTETTADKTGENHTQMFFATHNPIVAAQFKPQERFLLEWNEDGTVRVNKGKAPEGDDPNDLLDNDFKVRNLLGKAGNRAWEEYIDLKTQLSRCTDTESKIQLANKILNIGKNYNF